MNGSTSVCLIHTGQDVQPGLQSIGEGALGASDSDEGQPPFASVVQQLPNSVDLQRRALDLIHERSDNVSNFCVR